MAVTRQTKKMVAPASRPLKGASKMMGGKMTVANKAKSMKMRMGGKG